MNYVKDSNGDVIAYEGTWDTDSWNAYAIPADKFDGDISSLPAFDAPGMPWELSNDTQETAEMVVMQHMVRQKVAELTWNSGKQYHIGDVVYHVGKMWIATSNNTNNLPDSIPGDWQETD